MTAQVPQHAIRWDRIPVGPLDLEVEGSEDMTVYERVLDVMLAYELWSDLAIRRLHEIHSLKRSGMRILRQVARRRRDRITGKRVRPSAGARTRRRLRHRR
jgi:hypothetical protein